MLYLASLGLIPRRRTSKNNNQGTDRSMTSEHFETCSKKVRGRGMAQASIDLIAAMFVAAEAAHPITGRGIGYKLFTAGWIPSMDRPCSGCTGC